MLRLVSIWSLLSKKDKDKKQNKKAKALSLSLSLHAHQNSKPKKRNACISSFLSLFKTPPPYYHHHRSSLSPWPSMLTIFFSLLLNSSPTGSSLTLSLSVIWCILILWSILCVHWWFFFNIRTVCLCAES